jgi:hypothetical protein
MIIHTACELPGGGIRIVDVWDSREAQEAFGRDRIAPALQTVAERLGVDMSGMMPEQTYLEAFDVKMGR